MSPQLVDDGLDAQHEQLVAQVQPEFQIVLAGSVVEQGVQEGHDGSFEAHVIAIGPDAAVQVVDDRLEAGALAGVTLEVQHGLQDFAVTAGHETNGAQDLQHGHFDFGIIGGQALRDDFDRRRMGQNVSPAGLRGEQPEMYSSGHLIYGFQSRHTELFMSALMQPM